MKIITLACTTIFKIYDRQMSSLSCSEHPILPIFDLADISNIVYSYLFFFEKIQFACVSKKFKLLMYKRLSDNKKCDDLEEAMIKNKYKKFLTILKIDPTIFIQGKENITEKILVQMYTRNNEQIWEYMLDDDFKLDKNIHLFHIVLNNNCFVFLYRYFLKLKSLYSLDSTIVVPTGTENCKIYNSLYCRNYITNPKSNCDFVHNILNLGPCKNSECDTCTEIIKMTIILNMPLPKILNFDMIDNFLVRAAKSGADISFFSLYEQIKKIHVDNPDIDNYLHKKLNTLLMIVCKTHMLKNKILIIKFCIDNGANPYIILDGASSFCIIDEKYMHCLLNDVKFLERTVYIRNYILDNSKKYSHDLVMQNSLARCLQLISKYSTKLIREDKHNHTKLDLLFYFNKITMSDTFINNFLLMTKIQPDNYFFSQYVTLTKRIFSNISMAEYLNYLENLPTFIKNTNKVEDGEHIDRKLIDD